MHWGSSPSIKIVFYVLFINQYMSSLIFYNYFNELYYSILCLIGLLMIIMGLLIIYIGAVCVLMLFHIKLIKTFMIKSETNLYENNLFVPFFFVFFFLPIIQLTNISNILIKSTANTLLNKDINIFSFQYLNINSFLKWIDYVDSIHSIQVIAILLYNIYFINIIYGSFNLVLLISYLFNTIKIEP